MPKALTDAEAAEEPYRRAGVRTQHFPVCWMQPAHSQAQPFTLHSHPFQGCVTATGLIQVWLLHPLTTGKAGYHSMADSFLLPHGRQPVHSTTTHCTRLTSQFRQLLDASCHCQTSRWWHQQRQADQTAQTSAGAALTCAMHRLASYGRLLLLPGSKADHQGSQVPSA